MSQTWKYEKEKITEPTIGRVVYYYHPTFLKPCAALVADCDGLMVNLGVLNHDGTGAPACGVQHVSEAAQGQACWDWMPFQKGQAAKTEALQAELDAKNTAANSFGGQGAAGPISSAVDGSPSKK
jgi:hypothetical protein